VHGQRSERSGTYLGLEAFSGPFAAPLPEPSGVGRQLQFEAGTLGALRHFVAAQAESAGLGRSKTVDAVLSVNEIASNSIAHGGGRGLLRSWRSDARLVFEVRDRRRIEEPLVDRRLPTGDGVHGRGLWIANQLCDLVQIRSFPSETIVRVHVALA
jgi:anti-sigma regulatory factor (Ser/Thr protein kinase)